MPAARAGTTCFPHLSQVPLPAAGISQRVVFRLDEELVVRTALAESRVAARPRACPREDLLTLAGPATVERLLAESTLEPIDSDAPVSR